MRGGSRSGPGTGGPRVGWHGECGVESRHYVPPSNGARTRNRAYRVSSPCFTSIHAVCTEAPKRGKEKRQSRVGQRTGRCGSSLDASLVHLSAQPLSRASGDQKRVRRKFDDWKDPRGRSPRARLDTRNSQEPYPSRRRRPRLQRRSRRDHDVVEPLGGARAKGELKKSDRLEDVDLVAGVDWRENRSFAGRAVGWQFAQLSASQLTFDKHFSASRSRPRPRRHSAVIHWMDFMSDRCTRSAAASAGRQPGARWSSSNGSHVTAPRNHRGILSPRFVAKKVIPLVVEARFRKERRQDEAEGEHVAAEESARSQEVRRLSLAGYAINRGARAA